jgi:hypothetical protein
MVILAEIQFTEWLLLAAAVLVEQHLPHPLLHLWVVVVAEAVLIVIRQEQVVQVELVIQEHL